MRRFLLITLACNSVGLAFLLNSWSNQNDFESQLSLLHADYKRSFERFDERNFGELAVTIAGIEKSIEKLKDKDIDSLTIALYKLPSIGRSYVDFRNTSEDEIHLLETSILNSYQESHKLRIIAFVVVMLNIGVAFFLLRRFKC
jgi:hypothetical protein